MARPLARRSERACFFFFFLLLLIHSFCIFPQGLADVHPRFEQSFCAESVRVVSCCVARAQYREPACNVWKYKKEGERERAKKKASVAVAFFLKGQSYEITGLFPPEGGTAAMWDLADPFFHLLHLCCCYHLFSFFLKKKQSDKHTSSNFTDRHTWSPDQPRFSVSCAAWSRLEFHLLLNRQSNGPASRSICKIYRFEGGQCTCVWALAIYFRFLPKGRERNIQSTDLGSSSLKLQPCSMDFEADSRKNKLE